MHATDFVFRRHLGKKNWKIISKVNELCDVIGWVAPKLQEKILKNYKSQNYKREFCCVRVMLAKNMSFWALYWPTLFAIKQEKSILSDKNISSRSSDWESKEWRNLQYR
jgi:hypothetical protein